MNAPATVSPFRLLSDLRRTQATYMVELEEFGAASAANCVTDTELDAQRLRVHTYLDNYLDALATINKRARGQ